VTEGYPCEEFCVLIHLLIGLVGAGVFLRIVGKEKNRRYRHLLLRLAEQEKKLTEQQQAGDPAADPADPAKEIAVTAEPVPDSQAA
jgi:hypothetical protein